MTTYIYRRLKNGRLICILQLTSLCWTHGLYDAVLYVYNRGMCDYTTPLLQLLAILKSAIESGVQLTTQQVLMPVLYRYAAAVMNVC